MSYELLGIFAVVGLILYVSNQIKTIEKKIYELDEKIDTLLLCKSSEVHLMTTDQSIYEALGSIEDKSQINFNKLVKLMEVTEVSSYVAAMKKPRTILTQTRVDDIQKKQENNTAEKNHAEGGTQNV